MVPKSNHRIEVSHEQKPGETHRRSDFQKVTGIKKEEAGNSQKPRNSAADRVPGESKEDGGTQGFAINILPQKAKAGSAPDGTKIEHHLLPEEPTIIISDEKERHLDTRLRLASSLKVLESGGQEMLCLAWGRRTFTSCDY